MSHDALDALIATAKAHDVPPDGAQEQAWVGLAGALGQDLPVAEVATASKAATVMGAGAKGLAAVLLASAVGAGVGAYASRDTQAPTPPPPSSGPADALDPPVAQPVIAPPVPSLPTSAPATERRSEAPAATDRPRRSRSSAPTRSALVEEAKLVGEMWKALDAHDAARALGLAERHAERFPNGELAAEARAARLAARCAQGRPINLLELEAVHAEASTAVGRRLARACARGDDR